jgi:hypothetical protein
MNMKKKLNAIAKEFYHELNTNESYCDRFKKVKTFDDIFDLISEIYDGLGVGFYEIDDIMNSKTFGNNDEACDYFDNIIEEITKLVLKMKETAK